MQDFLARHDYGMFLDGNFTSAVQGTNIDCVSPVTNLKWKSIHAASKHEVEAAIASSKEAFSTWKKVPGTERSHILYRIGTFMEEHREALADIVVMEMGKPIKEARAEVDYAAGYFYWFAGEAARLYGMTIPSSSPDKRGILHKQPVGVCAMITPWNFPLAMPARKLGAAWAAGCTTVAKPSPETPISTLALAYISHEAGLPPGVFNVVCGNEKMIGETFLQSKDIAKLSFTGSETVGRYLYEKSAPTLKKLTLELGGHAPLIVFEDADINLAIQQTLAAKFRNSGQTCVCPNRIYVHESIYDAFAMKLVEGVKALRLGDPRLDDTELSHVLHPASRTKLADHLKDALDQGAKCLYSSEQAGGPKVIGQVTESMRVYREETFAPLLPLLSFSSEEEVVRMANDTPYGLSAYFFTRDLSRAHRVSEALDFGIIGVNDGAPSAPQSVFGGVKASGFGREGGPTGIDEYVTQKFVSVQV